MVTEYKCKYKYCKHNGIVLKDEAVKEGNAYYHSDCLKEKNEKKQIIDIFYKYINKTEVGAQLTRTVNTIVSTNRATSEFLLYALCYVIHHKIPLNHVAGLYYIINNNEIKTSYQNYKNSQVQKLDVTKVKTEEETQFKINDTDNRGWDKLLE